jgi:hypothetical protein
MDTWLVEACQSSIYNKIRFTKPKCFLFVFLMYFKYIFNMFYVCNKRSEYGIYRMFNLKVNLVLISVIYLLRFTTCYITQLTCIYSKCWKWCPFISMHLSTCFTMFLVTFLTVLSVFNHIPNITFYWRLPSKFFKETLSTVGVRHRFKITFQNKYTFYHC